MKSFKPVMTAAEFEMLEGLIAKGLKLSKKGQPDMRFKENKFIFGKYF